MLQITVTLDSAHDLEYYLALGEVNRKLDLSAISNLPYLISGMYIVCNYTYLYIGICIYIQPSLLLEAAPVWWW